MEDITVKEATVQLHLLQIGAKRVFIVLRELLSRFPVRLASIAQLMD